MLIAVMIGCLIALVLLDGFAFEATTTVYDSAAGQMKDKKYTLARLLLLANSVLLGTIGAMGYMVYIYQDNSTIRTATSLILVGGILRFKKAGWDHDEPIWTILSIAAIAIPVIIGICIAAG